jgi:4-diphosphocytidyl-2-C-methyl-D-erythritol kinase
MSLSGPAFAKINLGLHVLRKRSDGFHDIETVMIAVEWHDVIRVEPSERPRFTSSDHSLSGDDNLCVRAAELLSSKMGIGAAAAIRLEKHLPFGAGLGGGSADAAVTLVLLNQLWDARLSKHELRSLAAQLGSDVPFFIDAAPALAIGRGEILEPLSGYVFPFDLVIALPNERVSTAEAYSLVSPNDSNRPDIRKVVLSNDLERWSRELVNDFEEPILEKHPSIGAIKDAMLDAGAGYAAMSGSGSAVFGIFEDITTGRAAADAFREQGFITWHGRAVQ